MDQTGPNSRELPPPVQLNGHEHPAHHNVPYPPGYMASIPTNVNHERRPLTVTELERIARTSGQQTSSTGTGSGRGIFGGSMLHTGMSPMAQYGSQSPPSYSGLSGGFHRPQAPVPPNPPGYMHYRHDQHAPQHLAHNLQQSTRHDNMPRQHWQHQGQQNDMISDSIAALLQSDLRLSPGGSIVKQHHEPLPQANVRLPKVFLVDGVIPLDTIHRFFFVEHPDLWQLYHLDYDSNISSIIKRYIEWIKRNREKTQSMQQEGRFLNDHPKDSNLSIKHGKDEQKGDDDAVKQRYVKQEREERWVDIMDHKHDGRKPIGSMNRLNDVLISLAHDLSPTKDDKLAWKKAFEYTENKIKAFFSDENVNVVLFGSVANGLAVRSSNDIDVSVECSIPNGEEGEEEKALLIEAIGELLESDGMKDLLILSHARVPVVKFVYPSTQTQVDITIKNSLACLNTKMIAVYCAIDPRLAQLVHIVKHWAKKRNVNDPYKGTLSSYCYVLMCIFHLQTRSPPILPVLQSSDFPFTVSEQVGEWKVQYFDQVSQLKTYGFESKNTQNLAELVWEFFEFWAWKHNYLHDVVSIRLGKIISKESKDWTKRVGRDRHLLCVEDPFLLSHDLGRTVDMKSKDVMRKEFFRAATILRDFPVPENALFEPYTARQKKHYTSHRHGRTDDSQHRPNQYSNNKNFRH